MDNQLGSEWRGRTHLRRMASLEGPRWRPASGTSRRRLGQRNMTMEDLCIVSSIFKIGKGSAKPWMARRAEVETVESSDIQTDSIKV